MVITAVAFLVNSMAMFAMRAHGHIFALLAYERGLRAILLIATGIFLLQAQGG